LLLTMIMSLKDKRSINPNQMLNLVEFLNHLLLFQLLWKNWV
jgi:hypothetical protein